MSSFLSFINAWFSQRRHSKTRASWWQLSRVWESPVSLAKPDSLIALERITVCLRLKQKHSVLTKRAAFQYLYASVWCDDAPIRMTYFWKYSPSTRSWQKDLHESCGALFLQCCILSLLYFRLFLSTDYRLANMFTFENRIRSDFNIIDSPASQIGFDYLDRFILIATHQKLSNKSNISRIVD